MNNTVGAIVSGLFGVAIIAVVFAKPEAISKFFGGLGYATGAAVSPVTGRFPSYPSA
jgi:hypothetical protein